MIRPACSYKYARGEDGDELRAAQVVSPGAKLLLDATNALRRKVSDEMGGLET